MDPTSDARVALERLIAAAEAGDLSGMLETHDVDLIVAFGSATEAVGPAADLDLAVGCTGQLDAVGLMESLYAATGFERVDLLDLRPAGIVARGEALGHGRLVFERTPGTFAERQVVALTLMWDTRWLRDLELEQLAR
ncbi:hypothetical protein BH23ACT9_BH23ACT9_03760 [soil metagenome]